MEAGAAAGPAGGDAPAGGEAQTQPGEQQAQPDFGQLVQDGIGPVQAQLEEMRALLESNIAQPAEPGEPQADPNAPPDLSYLNPDAPNYDPQAAAQQFLSVLEQQNSAALQPLQQQLEKTQTQLTDMRTQSEARALAEEFPDLDKPEVSDKVFAAAQQWVEGLRASGVDIPPEAASTMPVIRAAYMMGRAAELANEEENGQQPHAATLEGAGGAAPAAPVGGLTAESIVGSGGRSALPF